MSATIDAALATEAVRAQIERILQSKVFRTSGVLRSLLTYLTDKCLAGDGGSLKEYAIGLDVLGKPASFDPRQESVVRMHTARLRQKLAEYYRTEGTDDPIVVEMPKGGFRVTFEPRPEKAISAPMQVPIEIHGPPVRGWRRREIVLAGALALA